MALSNTLQQLTIQEVEQLAISELLENLGIAILGAELVLPFALPIFGFVALGFAIADLVSLFGSGKPTSVDTNNVIRAYNMSAYQPLHLLAADLTEMLRNGAPISDSRPAIQAQFGQLKQGTVESIQQLAGAQPGAAGDGYWQLFQLIELTWYFAGDYNKVLDTVKGIDAFTIGLSQLEQQNAQGSGGGGQGGGGGGGQPQPQPPPRQFPGGNIPQPTPQPGPTPAPSSWPGGEIPAPCIPKLSASPDELERGFACLSENSLFAAYMLWLIYQALSSGGNSGGTAPQGDSKCCDSIVAALADIRATIALSAPASIDSDLKAIADAIASVAVGGSVDLSGLAAQLEALVAAVNQFEQCVCSSLNSPATAGADLAAKYRALVQRDVDAGFIDATEAQVLLS